MVCKNNHGQILTEFLILFIALACLFSVIRYKAIDLEKTKSHRWEKQ